MNALLYLILPGITLVILSITTYIIFINRVVPRDKAVVVNYAWSKQSEIISSRFGKSSYSYWPFLTQTIELPLANIEFEFAARKLNDKYMAPFNCTIGCWISVENPELVVEKVDFGVGESFREAVRTLLENQIISTARSTAANLDLEIDLIKNRQSLSNPVESAINGDLEQWGLKLVKLDILNFEDSEASTVIADLEKVRQSQVEATSRTAVAENDKTARLAEAQNLRISEEKEAESRKLIELANIAQRQATLIAEEELNQQVALQTKKANELQVHAEKTLEVGQATNKALAIEEAAKGAKQAKILEAQAEAEHIKQIAEAEADKIRQIGFSKAEAIEKEAEAQAKYNEAGMDLQQLAAWESVMISYNQEQAKAIASSDTKINFINSGNPDSNSNIFGIGLNAQTGAQIGQMLETLQSSSPEQVKQLINQFVKGTSRPTATPPANNTPQS